MNAQEPDRLESWKEIGAYLQRDVRTLGRWEKEEGLPIHRHTHRSRSSVYAYRSEIDAWREARKVLPAPPPPRPLWKMPAFGLTMALCLVMVGNGLRPQQVEAQNGDLRSRLVWSGDNRWHPMSSISSDGRYVTFEDDQLEMGLRDLTTGASRRVTSNGTLQESAEQAVISPDGSQVAYQYFTSHHEYRLAVIDIGGGKKPRFLRASDTSYFEPKGWTPDGKQVLITQEAADGIWQIALVSVADGKTHVLKSLRWGKIDARISPDGRYIAYASPADGQNSDIFVLAVDGSGETAVVQHPATDDGMVWSADGSRILFRTNRTGSWSLQAIPVKDGKAAGPSEIIQASFNGTLLGTDRNGVLYYSLEKRPEATHVYQARLDNPGSAPVIVGDAVSRNFGPDVSPEGERIAYRSNDRNVVIRDLKTNAEKVLPVPSKAEFWNRYGIGPKWFSNGMDVLIVTRQPDRPDLIANRMNVNTGKLTEILRGAPHDIPVPGLGNTVFDRNGDHDGIVRYDLDSGQAREIVKEKFTDPENEKVTDLAISPDGNQLVYRITRYQKTGGATELMLVPTAGGTAREIYRDSVKNGQIARYNSLAWTADQRYILFMKIGATPAEGQSIWRVPVAGGPPEIVLGKVFGANSLSAHPDGRSIFFTGTVGIPLSEIWALENFLPGSAK